MKLIYLKNQRNKKLWFTQANKNNNFATLNFESKKKETIKKKFTHKQKLKSNKTKNFPPFVYFINRCFIVFSLRFVYGRPVFNLDIRQIY